MSVNPYQPPVSRLADEPGHAGQAVSRGRLLLAVLVNPWAAVLGAVLALAILDHTWLMHRQPADVLRVLGEMAAVGVAVSYVAVPSYGLFAWWVLARLGRFNLPMILLAALLPCGVTSAVLFGLFATTSVVDMLLIATYLALFSLPVAGAFWALLQLRIRRRPGAAGPAV